jgi:hypothetical protein
MYGRLKYLVLVICVLVATVFLSILLGAAIRYNRRAGLFDQSLSLVFFPAQK